MPPKLSTGGRADPPTEPRPAHNTWPMHNVKKPPGRGKKHCGSGGQNHHVQGQLSELPRMLPQLRERSRNFGNVPEVSPRLLRDFPMGAIGPPRFCEVHPWGNFGNLAFFACMRQRHRLVLWALSTLTRPHSWGVHGSMSGVAHLCRAARGMCARAQRRPVPWDSCPPIATACVVAIPIRGSQRADRDCWLDICFEKFLIDDRSLVEPLCERCERPLR